MISLKKLFKNVSLAVVLVAGSLFTANAQESNIPPIFTAIQRNNVQQVESMLDSGTDPGSSDMLRNTALHQAAFYGYEKIIELLVAKGADINAVNEAGQTPLYSAIHADHVQAVEALLNHGASLSTKYTDNRYTALHLAALDGKYEVAEALLKKGANTKAKDANGKKPIDYAKATKDKTFVKLFKDKRWK
ncbi:MAG: hypothetical protein CMO01_03425 [Thalassobius sp.]|nr:hypothetical protein [Thalassovita sp.]